MSMRSDRRRALLQASVAMALLAGLLAGPAAAQGEEAATGIQLTPARLEQDVDSERIEVKVAVRNNDPVARTVEVTVVGLGHGLDGTPWVLDDVPARRLSLDPVRLRLAPGETRELVVAGDLEGEGGGFYGAVTAEAVVDGDGASGVGIRTRVAGTLLLRGPGPWDERIEVEDVVLRALEGGDYEVAAVVRDHGDVHVRPTGTLTIRRGAEVLATVAVDGSYYVLPGYARRLGGRWSPPAGLEGPLTVEARFDGHPSVSRSIPFPLPVEAGAEDGDAPAPFDAGEGATLLGRDDAPGGAASGLVWAVAALLLAVVWMVLLLVVIGRRRRHAAARLADGLATAATELAARAPVADPAAARRFAANAHRIELEARELAVVGSWPVGDLAAAAADLAAVASSLAAGDLDLAAASRLDRWLTARDPEHPSLAEVLCTGQARAQAPAPVVAR